MMYLFRQFAEYEVLGGWFLEASFLRVALWLVCVCAASVHWKFLEAVILCESRLMTSSQGTNPNQGFLSASLSQHHTNLLI